MGSAIGSTSRNGRGNVDWRSHLDLDPGRQSHTLVVRPELQRHEPERSRILHLAISAAPSLSEPHELDDSRSSSAGMESWNSVRTSRSLRPSATAQKYHPLVDRFRNAIPAADGDL